MDERSASTVYGSVGEFVEHYLGFVYARQVEDRSDTVWCPEWWRHAEAAIRLEAVWRAWEHSRMNGTAGMSTWLLEHADPHMYRLFDPRGPFRYCGAQKGHRELLAPLPVESPETLSVDSPGFAEPARGDAAPRVHADVGQFVENYVSPVYRRQVSDVNDTVWCPQWWKHAEAVLRLEALWRAWEYFRQDGRTGMSLWFIDHADRQMNRLFGPRGPFMYCSARNGHRDVLEPLPVIPPPDGLFAETAAESIATSGGSHFGSLVRFVEDYLSPLYRRQVIDLNNAVWCPEWWRHSEAVIRLDSLWRTWEVLGRDSGKGMSVWFLDHADPHMNELFDHRGPFAYCSARNGHRDGIAPLPLRPPNSPGFSESPDEKTR
ncbi:DUF4913 domain-containing protein [Nocardia vaccinii]|uniref:DUF4913 domain-containing protein n=1 Tax=Nocardia vaccinii TaxID=1822 RepID=UPI000A98325F|nr:DUF4913 domain-containing protein [Nocardia vaccinii]